MRNPPRHDLFKEEQLMNKRETVQNLLTVGEIRDLHLAVLAQMPLNLDPAKVRADLKSKTVLGSDLGKFFRNRYAAQTLIDTASWVDFYRRIFGKEVDLNNLHVPTRPEYECWPIVMVPDISNNDAFEACKKQFGKAWRYVDDLNTVHDVVNRPDGPYVVWVKANVEADPDLANVSAKEVEDRGCNTLALRERFVLELKYFDETKQKQHLDIENWTLCAGSRYAGGGVPCVCWDGDGAGLSVDWCSVGGSHPHLRARSAVS